MMRNLIGWRAVVVVIAVLAAASVADAQEIPADYKAVLDLVGKPGDFKNQVLKLNIPRNDLKVTVDGVSTPTPLGFGGWLALTKGDGGVDVMMGDLVLTEDEVNPVMSGWVSTRGRRLPEATIRRWSPATWRCWRAR